MSQPSKPSKTSVQRLRAFLSKEYLNNPAMGSPDMSTAFRDVLTDLLLLGDVHDVNVHDRLMDAEEVYQKEIVDSS